MFKNDRRSPSPWRTLLGAVIAASLLSVVQTASANTIVSPYGNAAVDVYIVKAADIYNVVPAAITVRRSDGACSIGIFNHTNGVPSEQPRYNSGSGNDRISFWNDNNWNTFVCGPWTLWVTALDPGNYRPVVSAGGGHDTVHEHSYATLIYLGDGNDAVVLNGENATSHSDVYGGRGNDAVHIFSNNAWVYAEDGDDVVCSYNSVFPGLLDGGPHWDTLIGTGHFIVGFESQSGVCPPLPQ